MEVESDNLPEFFNVYITNLFSNHMLIPREFVPYMGRRKSGLAVLVAGPSGETWCVKLVEVGTDLYFTDGWPDFVKENSVQDGNFLFFKCHGNLKFSVVMYDESMCEKKMVKSSRGRGGILEAKEEQDGVNDMMRRNLSMRTFQPETDISMPSGANTIERTSMSLKPFFEKCIPATNVNLYIPKTFLRENSLSYKSYEKMVLRTDGNSWEVNIIIHHRGTILCGGWYAFVHDNCINAGDICKFELLDRLEMMVHIQVALTRKKGSQKEEGKSSSIVEDQVIEKNCRSLSD